MKSYKESRLHTAFSDHYLKMKFLWKPRFSINLKSLWTTSSNIRPITSAIMPSASFAFLWTFQGKRSTPGAHTEKTQKPVLQNSSNTSGPRRNKCKCFGTHFSVYFNLVFPLNNISSPLGRAEHHKREILYKDACFVITVRKFTMGKSDWMFNLFRLPRLTDTWEVLEWEQTPLNYHTTVLQNINQ